MTEPIKNRESWPLDWPAGWPRIPASSRKRSPFQGPQFARDRDEVIYRLQRRASHVIVTTALPMDTRGLPNAQARLPDDPGVAVWWVERGRERVMACDRWRHIAENMRAVNLSLQALAGLDRWGAAEMVERAFSGFAALPPPGGTSTEEVKPPIEWRRILDIDEAGVQKVMGDAYSTEMLLQIVKKKYRVLVSQVHPDKGGVDAERAIELNEAMSAAEGELA